MFFSDFSVFFRIFRVFSDFSVFFGFFVFFEAFNRNCQVGGGIFVNDLIQRTIFDRVPLDTRKESEFDGAGRPEKDQQPKTGWWQPVKETCSAGDKRHSFLITCLPLFSGWIIFFFSETTARLSNPSDRDQTFKGCPVIVCHQLSMVRFI